MIARYLMITAAMFTGTYALVSWIGGLLTDAGIAGAFCAALVLISEGIAYCQRRSIERARLARAEVWERRDESLSIQLDLWHGHSLDVHRAMWPHEIGGFE